MKKYRAICLLLVLLMNLQVFAFYASATEATTTTASTQNTGPDWSGTNNNTSDDSSVSSGCRSLDGQVPLWGSGKLLETAGAAMLYEINSDTIMYAWNPDIQMYPASLVKIMTALLAVENGNLSDKVSVSANALAALPKDATLHFKVGETWTLEEFLYCMMVGNYGDAAVVIAEHIAGSQKGFVNMMNQRAQELGCTGTLFVNPTGYHDDAQISTARDMVKLLNEAYKNELFRPFFSEIVYRLPATENSDSRYMETTNFMMTMDVTPEYYDTRVTGGRTGVTDSRQRCLIVTAESKGLRYIAIVMGAISTFDEDGKTIIRFGSYEEVKELLKKGFDGYRLTQVLSNDQTLALFPVINGENSVTVGPSETAYAVLPDGITSQDLTLRFENDRKSLEAPIKTGELIDTVQVWYDNVCIAQSPVVSCNSSGVYSDDEDTAIYGGDDSNKRTAVLVIGVIVCIIIAVIGLGRGVQIAHRASVRAQHRRRRRNRRRSR